MAAGRSPRIRILPDRLVSQIAAGEVVERPASVVKELLENALDAGAGRVAIELEGGGKRRIRVLDDGSGMGPDDVLLAFDRHATSKIATFDDLEAVATLGFRGEALAAIAAVARVELTAAEEDGSGQRVRVEGGRILERRPAPHPRGTTVEVASLFFNVPARRKFLKSPQTELRRAVEVVQGYALGRPAVALGLAHEGRTLLDLPAAPPSPAGRSGAAERISQLFGADFARRLTELGGVAARHEGLAGLSPVPAGGETVGGFVGDPATARGRRQFVFVNGRLLRDRAVLATFYRAVRDEWRSEEFPALFLFLDLPAAGIDVNVHPQKAEIRFRDPGLLDRLYAALREGLARARGAESVPLRPPGPEAARWPLAWRGSAAGSAGPGAGHGSQGSAAGEVAEGGAPDASALRLAEIVYAPLERSSVPLSGRAGGPRSFRLLAQYKGSLLLLEGPDGLYVVDQHVAHERILYERFRRELERQRPASQRLLEPVLLAAGPAERERLAELTPELEEHGFGLAPLSGGSLALTAVPAVLSAAAGEGLLLELAGDERPAEGPSQLRGRLLDALAASQACRAAVKMHHPLTPAEMEALVTELFAAEHPWACPHGRPVVLRMGDAELERRFGRR